MSTPIAQYKLPSRIEIGFDSETKASIADLKVKLDEANKSLSARDSGLWSESKKKSNSRIGQIIATAISNQIKETLRPDGLLKEMSPPDGLLKAMQAEAANDSNGVAPTHYEAQLHCGWVSHFDVDLLKPTINRETVNDVDYLSGNDLDECVPHIDDVLDQPNWLSESVPQITQADMQLIFIKNLSEVLIQRMHSMNRFSEDDYAIGGNDLKAWDIVVDCDGLFGFTVCDLIHHESNLLNRVRILRLKKFQDTTFTHGAIINGWRMDDINWHTITEDQLPAFRVALEACYA